MTKQTNGLTLGQSKVRVMKRLVDERSGRETTIELHHGVVVSHGTSFVRVFNPLPVNQGGDVSPEVAENFPIRGRNLWIEYAGELKHAMRVPFAFAR